MKPTVACCLFFLCCLSRSYGQPATYGGAGSFRIGYASLHQVSRVFAQTAPATLAPLGTAFVCMGGEGYARLNKYIVGGGGYGMARRPLTRNTIHAEPFSGGGFLQAGRILLDQPRFWLYPTLGAGFSAIGLTQYEQTPTGEHLNERTVLLTNVNVHLGLGIDWLAVRIDSDDRERYGGVLIGLRVGYQLSPLVSYRQDDDLGLVEPEPRYATNGYFVTLTVGAGGFVRR
ncbi:hypothetical protein DYU11_23180 [Fibrisoma montanum]|uniref:Outer membrane protein beta-barrel domain-containing protein n=1 Tax=Fibrisoma montanum TaxID=2305895 RepID=A0A418M261_9BACT|nr:hypothetical protein [Fibrisoma montanum]RIV19832.1 hypothetical protein DYU11_23180 [Fibrisoma montanum]